MCEWTLRATGHAGLQQIIVIEAGEHGHRDHFAMFARSRFGILEHRAPARAMHGDNRGFEHMDRLHRGGDGVGDIVQFEIKEDRQPDLGDLVNPVMSVRAKEFEAKFQPANMITHLFSQSYSRIETRQIKRKIDRIGHSASLYWWAAASSWLDESAADGAPSAFSSVVIRRDIRQRVAR